MFLHKDFSPASLLHNAFTLGNPLFREGNLPPQSIFFENKHRLPLFAVSRHWSNVELTEEKLLSRAKLSPQAFKRALDCFPRPLEYKFAERFLRDLLSLHHKEEEIDGSEVLVALKRKRGNKHMTQKVCESVFILLNECSNTVQERLVLRYGEKLFLPFIHLPLTNLVLHHQLPPQAHIVEQLLVEDRIDILKALEWNWAKAMSNDKTLLQHITSNFDTLLFTEGVSFRILYNVVKMHIDRGIDLNAKTSWSRDTALDMLCKHKETFGFQCMYELLEKHGAIRWNTWDELGMSFFNEY